MPLYTSPDGHILFAMETAGEGDGNSVVYYDGVPVWDRFSYEASHGIPRAPTPPSPPSPPTVAPPSSPPPRPSASPRLIPVTSAADGEFVNRMYSYWSNAFVIEDVAFIFAGHVDGRPRFFRVTLSTGHVERYDALMGYLGTTEGWSWDAEGWIYLLNGPQLRRVNPFTGEDRLVCDISESHPGCQLWQSHSSDDGQTHSATVQQIMPDGRAYPHVGTVLCQSGRQQYFPAQGELDESQITSDGAYLIIKEDDNNRIVTVATGEERILADDDGAVGHSDCGPSYIVGEDNIHGACVFWDLRQSLTRRRELFHTWSMGHLSIRAGRCLLSDASALSLVDLENGSRTHLWDHGMVGTDYDHQVFANLDPSGRVACYLSNVSGRMDVYLVVL